ncbi:MAG: response regulator [Pseudomonadota bacterium]
MYRNSKDVSILLVEDDDIDVRVIERSFRKCGIASPIVRAKDGLEALEILRGRHSPEWPFIVLLDINMPRMNGLEFLGEIRRDASLAGITVFVLTTSEAERDKFAAYSQHIAGYLLKSDGADQFLDVINLIGQYLETVRFTDQPLERQALLDAAGRR